MTTYEHDALRAMREMGDAMHRMRARHAALEAERDELLKLLAECEHNDIRCPVCNELRTEHGEWCALYAALDKHGARIE